MVRAGTDCEEELGWACGPNVVCGGGSVCKGRTVREEVGVAKHSLPALVGRRALDQVVFRFAREGTDCEEELGWDLEADVVFMGWLNIPSPPRRGGAH